MPLTHTSPFTIRYHELDGYGHVNNVVYLRLMQEAAMAASAAAGYGLERYAEMGRAWHIHQTEIEYLGALRYRDAVNVTTWVADFSGVRSRRMYVFERPEPGEVVARAYSDWAFLDTTSGLPVAIPPEMRTAFLAEGEPVVAVKREPVFKRQPFPEPPPPPPGTFITRRRVEWLDVDAAGHVNNASYLAYLGECAFQAAAHFGWTAERTWAAGFGILARKHRIQYLAPAVYGDELEIATYLFDAGAASVTRHFRVTRVGDGALIARANSLYVWVDKSSLRPVRIPPEVRAAMALNSTSAANSANRQEG